MSNTEAPGLPGPNGGDLVVALMDELGVDVAFGLVSVHNLPLVDAIARQRRFVPVRHEAAAVNAADAYARVTGKVGIAITSTGTGAGNAAGALVEALAAGSPVLHLTGNIDSDKLGRGAGFIHETKDQIGMLRAVSKAAYTIYAPGVAASLLAGAASEAMSGPRGPVSVEWPVDLQYAVYPPGDRFEIAPTEAPAPDAGAIARAAELIAQAERPVIWAGGGAVYAREETAALLTRLRAGLVTSNSGRGTVDEGHGACVGNYAATPAGAALLKEADLLISIGTHFRSNETNDYRLELPARQVQIDIDPASPGRVYPAEVGIVGDAPVVLRALLDALPEKTATDDEWLTRVATARRQARTDQRAAIGWQAEVCDAVQKAFPREAVFARDVTIPSSTWGNRLLSVRQPESNVFPHGGGIGQGLAMAIGAAVGQPDLPTLCLVGDGGLAVHFGELQTLAQERPWLVVLLYNDRGYGVLRNTQDVYLGERTGVDLATPDFGELSHALNLPYWRVTGTDGIEQALADALSTRGPAIVEVDVDAMGPMPRPFTPPVTIPTA